MFKIKTIVGINVESNLIKIISYTDQLLIIMYKNMFWWITDPDDEDKRLVVVGMHKHEPVQNNIVLAVFRFDYHHERWEEVI